MDSGLRLQDNIPIKLHTQSLNRSLIPTSKGEVYLCFVSKHKNNLVSKDDTSKKNVCIRNLKLAYTESYTRACVFMYYTSICNTQVKVHVIHVLHKIALRSIAGLKLIPSMTTLIHWRLVAGGRRLKPKQGPGLREIRQGRVAPGPKGSGIGTTRTNYQYSSRAGHGTRRSEL